MGVSWELLRTSGSTKEGVQIRLGTLLGLVCSLLAAEDGLGSVMGLFWLVLGAPEGLFRVVLASVEPISTIKTAFPSFDILFSLAVVVVVVGGGVVWWHPIEGMGE